jgi:glucokinase
MAVGVDIGGTKIAAGLVAADGRIVHRSIARTPRPANADAILALVERLVARELSCRPPSARQVEAIGIGTAGVVDPRSGIVVSATETLQGWVGVDLRTSVSAATGLPTSVDNDVNATALAEIRLGPGRGRARALVVSAGTGIGGAIALAGSIDRGSTGSAGEVGHLPIGPVDGPRCSCGRRGHLEAYASGPAIVRRYRELLGATVGRDGDLREVVRRARADDAVARRAIGEAGAVLGRALGGLVSVLDPDIVIVCGGVMSAGSLYLVPMRQAFRTEVLPPSKGVRIARGKTGSAAAMIGAALMALDEHGRDRSRQAASGPSSRIVA